MKRFILLISLNTITYGLVKSQSCVIAKSFAGHKEAILGIAQSPNGKYILSGSDDNFAFLWNENGEIIDTIDVHLKSVNDVVFSPDNTRFITAGSECNFVIWNLGGVSAASFTPDGKSMLTASFDKTAVIWNLNGKPITSFEDHYDEINQAEFSSDGKFILTASEDGTAKLWNITGTLIKKFEEKNRVDYTAATFSKDGLFAIVSSKDNKINF